ncbi:MAG: GDP-mannose 4,6-dehydratase [Thermoproteota archaeon]
MRILVTGGAGFIGSHAVEYFAKNDNEVIALDNFLRNEILGKKMKDQFHNWNYIKQYKNVKLIKGDIRNFSEIKDVARNVEVIIHTAAQVAVTTSLINPRVDFEINTLGTFNVLEIARLNDSSIIFCSTNKVYGENVNKIPIEEKETRYEFADPRYKEGIPEDFPVDLTGHSPYGCSKLAADIYVQDYAYTYGLKTAVFRQSCIYGERQFGVEDQGWVAWFVIATLTDRPITIYGNGKQVRDLLYVEDLIKAFDMFLNSKVKHVVLNIGGGQRNTLSLIETLNILKQLTGKIPSVSFATWRPMDQKVYVSNIKKAKETLNWEPQVNPKEGIKNLVKWVRENLTLFR